MRNKNGGNEIVRSLQMLKKIYKLPPSPLVLQHLHHQSPRRKTPQRTHHLPSVPFVLTFRKGAIPVTRREQLFAGLGNIFEDRESSWRRKGRWNLDIFGIAPLLICHSDSRSLLQFCKYTEKKIPKILTERTIHMTSTILVIILPFTSFVKYYHWKLELNLVLRYIAPLIICMDGQTGNFQARLLLHWNNLKLLSRSLFYNILNISRCHCLQWTMNILWKLSLSPSSLPSSPRPLFVGRDSRSDRMIRAHSCTDNGHLLLLTATSTT